MASADGKRAADASCSWATLSSRVYGLRPEPGLLAWGSAPRLPGRPSAPSGIMRRISARSQWRDRAGFSPDFPRPPADGPRKHTPAVGQTRTPPLQSPADAPPSSRGLGRRPLTAETGVRIPVAVLAKALLARGLSTLPGRAVRTGAAAPRLGRGRRPSRRRTGPDPRSCVRIAITPRAISRLAHHGSRFHQGTWGVA